MSDVNVLVVFYSRYGAAEKLALAAGVGAIQANGNIRLRRVADLAGRETIDASADWRANLDRMNRDYVAPRPADPQWADVIILGTPADSPRELEQYVDSLCAVPSLAGKIAGPLCPGNATAALKPLYAAAAGAGLIVAPAAALPDPADPGDEIERARAFGRRIVQMARTLRQAAAPG